MRRAALLAVGALLLCPARARAADPLVLFIDFSDGSETLSKADVDNATQNQSSIGAVTRYPPFAWPGIADGTLSRRDLIRTVSQRVNDLFLPYNLLVTTTRPATGTYTMVMVGGSPTLLGFDARIAGVAFMDCDNRQPSNIAFTFPTALRGSVHGLVVTIAQEAAHTFGLEHTMDPTDVMHPKLDPAQARFQDRSSGVSDRLCGREVQNSHRRLLEIVGPWPGGDKPFDGSRPDTDAPVVIIREPAAGAAVPQPFDLQATVQDDSVVDHVTVEAGGQTFTATRGPFAWSLAGFPPGPLTVRVTAVDSAGNQATGTLEVTVGDDTSGGCAVSHGGRSGAPALGVLLFAAAFTCYRRRGRL